MESLGLLRPTDEYADEIREYRQECLDADGYTHGDSGAGKAGDILGWIEYLSKAISTP